MGTNEFILLLALAVALGSWGMCQALLTLLARDRQKLHKRLTSEWRSNVDGLLQRSITVSRPGENVPALLQRSGVLREINRRLVCAFPEARLSRFLLLAGSVALAGFLLATLLTDSILLGVLVGAAGGYVPMLVVDARRSHRQRQLAGQLPDALDFLGRILKAGHSLSTGLQMMGEELPRPIGEEFRRCYGQHSLGQSLEECLREMARRIESTDFAFFVTSVLIQRQTGGDLSEVLRNISMMLRSRIRLQQHVKAVTAEGRLTGNILVAFPAVLFAIIYALNPNYAGVLVNTPLGNMLLGGAVLLQVMGLVAIRRIVTVKV